MAIVRIKRSLENINTNLSVSFFELKRMSASEAFLKISFLILLYLSQFIITWKSFSTQFIQNGHTLCSSAYLSKRLVPMRKGARQTGTYLKKTYVSVAVSS